MKVEFKYNPGQIVYVAGIGKVLVKKAAVTVFGDREYYIEQCHNGQCNWVDETKVNNQ